MEKLVNRLFPKPYCSGSMLSISATLTALAIVFYSTEGNMVRSLFSYSLFITFLGTLVLTFVLFLILGHVSHALDKAYPWEAGREERLFRQLFYGGLCLGILAFGIVMTTYKVVVGIDLNEREYLERDFVVLMGALLVVNYVHKSVYWRRKAQNESLVNDAMRGKIEEMKDQMVSRDQELALHADNYSRITVENMEIRQRAADGLAIAADMDKYIAIVGREDVQVGRVVAFFLTDLDKVNRTVTVRMQDGNDLTVAGICSLSAVEDLFPYVCVRLTRDLLINRYAIATVQKVGVKYQVKSSSEPLIDTMITEDVFRKMVEKGIPPALDML